MRASENRVVRILRQPRQFRHLRGRALRARGRIQLISHDGIGVADTRSDHTYLNLDGTGEFESEQYPIVEMDVNHGREDVNIDFGTQSVTFAAYDLAN